MTAAVQLLFAVAAAAAVCARPSYHAVRPLPPTVPELHDRRAPAPALAPPGPGNVTGRGVGAGPADDIIGTRSLFVQRCQCPPGMVVASNSPGVCKCKTQFKPYTGPEYKSYETKRDFEFLYNFWFL
uniref:Uncharacterized protein n=1 Tax=Sipha flava TaxID=143950 RepID=A0A2S2Q8P6_9HEMI